MPEDQPGSEPISYYSHSLKHCIYKRTGHAINLLEAVYCPMLSTITSTERPDALLPSATKAHKGPKASIQLNLYAKLVQGRTRQWNQPTPRTAPPKLWWPPQTSGAPLLALTNSETKAQH